MSRRKIIKQLKSLKNLEAAGRPQADWVLSSRQILMSQIQPQAENNLQTNEGREAVYYWQYFRGWFGAAVLKPVAAMALAIVMLFGYSAVFGMANSSLPGQAFYPVKTTSERVQLALTFSEGKRVQLQMDFVTRRVDDLQLAVSRSNNPQDQARIIKNTMKKISSDTKSLKDQLNKISLASADVVETAKQLDSKSLLVGQTLVKVNDSLSGDVQKAVVLDMSEAIKSTQAVGTSALGVMVKKYESGGGISDGEIVDRLAERIKNVEQNIQGAASQFRLDLSASTTVNMIVSTSTTNLEHATTTVNILNQLNSAAGSSTASTTVAQAIVSQPQQAQTVIEQAKDLLDNKDFNSVLEKINESNNLVSNLVGPVDDATIQVKIEDPSTATGTSATTTSGTE